MNTKEQCQYTEQVVSNGCLTIAEKLRRLENHSKKSSVNQSLFDHTIRINKPVFAVEDRICPIVDSRLGIHFLEKWNNTLTPTNHITNYTPPTSKFQRLKKQIAKILIVLLLTFVTSAVSPTNVCSISECATLVVSSRQYGTRKWDAIDCCLKVELMCNGLYLTTNIPFYLVKKTSAFRTKQHICISMSVLNLNYETQLTPEPIEMDSVIDTRDIDSRRNIQHHSTQTIILVLDNTKNIRDVPRRFSCDMSNIPCQI